MSHVYRIYENKLKYFEFVCHREQVPYELYPNEGMNYRKISMDISRSKFEEILDDIDCEIQRENSKHPEIPVISFRTMMQPKKFQRLVAGRGVFRPLSRDKEKFREF
ncbi:MAG: hypothetical protein E7271_10035 [Lachnospiraceae bacterium]|nr:hypothetical protein [Lachnospiraceae bacterium]